VRENSTRALTVIKGGQTTGDRRLDRVREPADLRRLNWPALALPQVAAGVGAGPVSRVWPLPGGYAHGLRLDQGQEGGCVGAGWGYELAALPSMVGVPDYAWCRERIYWPAQRDFDQQPGGAYPGASPFYEGTTVEAGAKACRALGLIDAWHWPQTWVELGAALSHNGPVVAGVDWTDGMMRPDATGIIHATGSIVGGHCVCLLGALWRFRGSGRDWDDVDAVRTRVVVPQSWGRGHGVDGLVYLPLVDLLTLWPAGDFIIPTGRHLLQT
jgi:hypothetical protein